ncbi:MAG: hypothetical protein NTZ05_01185, partial [Chloroflexi bacterium]|nr:hypothetical protein [Chloroflexota bacterium]
LALTDEATPKPLDAFYRQRMLGVFTGSSAAVSTDRLNDSLGITRGDSGGKGGGGGGDGSDANGIRSQFKATAYWNAAVTTGADGQAAVAVTLPDNLTTWRMTAVAITADTRAGTAQNEIVTSKDLLLRPAIPRFLMAGDQTTIEAAVRNGGGSPIEAEVTLTADGLTVEGGPKRVQIPAGGEAKAGWTVKAGAGVGAATVKLTARAGAAADG